MKETGEFYCVACYDEDWKMPFIMEDSNYFHTYREAEQEARHLRENGFQGAFAGKITLERATAPAKKATSKKRKAA